jgi:hypothetical protein
MSKSIDIIQTDIEKEKLIHHKECIHNIKKQKITDSMISDYLIKNSWKTKEELITIKELLDDFQKFINNLNK